MHFAANQRIGLWLSYLKEMSADVATSSCTLPLYHWSRQLEERHLCRQCVGRKLQAMAIMS